MDMTLKPTNLVDFTSLFHKTGYSLEKVIGTTYSLHYETLLMLILAMIYGPGADDAIDKNSNEISPAALLAAIRKIKEKDILTVFCQADKASMMNGKNEEEKNLLSLLDAFIAPVPMMGNKNGTFSSFHSKVWLIAFKKEENNKNIIRSFRLIVTSRNLTSNRDFDAVAVYESSKDGTDNVTNAISNQIGELPEIFKEAKFRVKAYSFLQDEKESALKRCHSIFSPFLDAHQLEQIDHPVNIFSMDQEICKLGEIGRYDKIRFFMLNPDMNANAENDESSDGKHFGLHAKLYIGDDFMILGSSNFTSRGLTQNREFNVKINAGISENDLLDSLGIGKKKNKENKPEEENSDWLNRIMEEKRGMFLPYQPPEKPEKEPSDAEKELNKILQELACCQLKAEYNTAGKLSLSINYQPGTGVSIQWKPLLEGDFKDVDLCWEISKEKICRIFICKVEIDGADAVTLQMLATLSESADVWEERFTVEKKKINIEDEINFRMLYIENADDLYGRMVPLKENAGESSSGNRIRMPQPPIFERLLELNQEQLKLFFQDPPLKCTQDSSGLYDAFMEMGKFFGFYQNEENKK